MTASTKGVDTPKKDRKVKDVKFDGEKRFFAAIKKADSALYPVHSFGVAGTTIQVFVNQLEATEEAGENFLQVGGKLLGDYIDLTCEQYVEVLKRISERRVHWFRNAEGKERRAVVYKNAVKSSLKILPNIEQTEPLSKYIVLLPLDDCTPGERNPEIEPSVLDVFPEMADEIKD